MENGFICPPAGDLLQFIGLSVVCAAGNWRAERPFYVVAAIDSGTNSPPPPPQAPPGVLCSCCPLQLLPCSLSLFDPIHSQALSYDSGTKHTVAMGADRLRLDRLMRIAHARFLSDTTLSNSDVKACPMETSINCTKAAVHSRLFRLSRSFHTIGVSPSQIWCLRLSWRGHACSRHFDVLLPCCQSDRGRYLIS